VNKRLKQAPRKTQYCGWFLPKEICCGMCRVFLIYGVVEDDTAAIEKATDSPTLTPLGNTTVGNPGGLRTKMLPRDPGMDMSERPLCSPIW
jgi:hypothetical protein